MKKFSFIIIGIMLTLCISLTSCSLFDGLYQDRMREYYSDDENYVELEGEIVDIYFLGTMHIAIPLDSDFNIYKQSSIAFKLYSHKELIDLLAVGDTIKFTSARRNFYDGHKLPIVHLEKNGEVLLTFEEGKAGLLEWVEAFA